MMKIYRIINTTNHGNPDFSNKNPKEGLYTYTSYECLRMIMVKKVYPKLDEGINDLPYNGLFLNSLRDSLQIRMIEEIVADPYHDYRPIEFKKLLKASDPAIRTALKNLIKQGIIVKNDKDKQHPRYTPKIGSKRLVALTFLAFAVQDDEEGTNFMDDAIIEYYNKVLIGQIQPPTIATRNELSYTDVASAKSYENFEKARISTFPTNNTSYTGSDGAFA